MDMLNPIFAPSNIVNKTGVAIPMVEQNIRKTGQFGEIRYMNPTRHRMQQFAFGQSTGPHIVRKAALMKAVLVAILLATPAVAGDLVCTPDTLCIDDQCQAGSDPREEVVLRGWDTPTPVLHTQYDDVAVVRSDSTDQLTWTGRNPQAQVVTLTVRPSDGAFSNVISLEDGSAGHSLTARGHCEVRG